MDYSKLITQYQALETAKTAPSTPQTPTARAQAPETAPTPTPVKSRSLFERLGEVIKPAREILASKYSTIPKVTMGFAVGGPIGAATAYTGTRPIETLETAAGLVKNIGKFGVQASVQNPAVGELAGVVGGPEARASVMQPRKVPLLGTVKPWSADERLDPEAQTATESAIQAGSIYLEGGMPGAIKLLSKAVGPFSKWAKKLSTISDKTLAAAQTPETAKKLQALRSGTLPEPVIPQIPNIPAPAKPVKVAVPEFGPAPGTPEELKMLGEKAYSTAKGAEKTAMEMYGTTRESIIKSQEGKLIQRSKEFVRGAQDALNKEGISIRGGKVDLVGSQFEGAEGAKGYLQRVYEIMSRPVARKSGKTVADDLLTRREALSNVIESIPESERSLRRVVGNMRNSFDDTLDVILGPEAAQARQQYRTTMQATRPVIDAMTKVENGKQVFSEDKAYTFINSALKESKFDNTRLLTELDDVAKTATAKDVAKIEEARLAYEKALEASKAEVARINAQAKQAYDAAKTDRARQLIEAKRVRDEAAATAKSELDALKKLNASLSKISPEVTDSLFSVVRRQLTNLPVVGNKLTPFFSPKFWGDIALSKGLKAANPAEAAKSSRNFQLWLLANMLTSSINDLVTETGSEE